MNSHLRRPNNGYAQTFSTSAGYTRLLPLIGLVLVLAPALFAQSSNPGDPKRGSAPGASYSISDIENINLTNGNLSLNMPLAKLPGGRGGTGGWIGYTYNSKLYKPQVESVIVNNAPSDRNLLKASDEGGWRGTSSLDFRLKEVDRFSGGALAPIDCGPGMSQHYWKNEKRWKLQVTMPDGGDKDFRPIGFTDQEDDGFFALRSDGTVSTFNPSTCQGSTFVYSTGPLVYYSADGSSLRLLVDPLTHAFTLYFPDGSYYQSSSARLTDRNGNFVQQSAPFQYNGRTANGIEDSVGHKIFSTAGDNANERDIYQLGFNGAPIKWTVKTKSIYVRRDYTATANDSVRQRGAPSAQTAQEEFTVLDKITLPTQIGGQAFEFAYNGSNTPVGSGYSSGWGEINLIKLPSGAEVSYEFLHPIENTDKILSGPVTKKTLSYLSQYEENASNHRIQEVWNYTFNPLTGETVVSSPDGTSTTHRYYPIVDQNPLNGYIRSIETSTGITEKVWATNATPWGGYNYFLKYEFSSIKSAYGGLDLTAAKEFSKDKNGNTTVIKEYDFIDYCQIPRSVSYCIGDPTGPGYAAPSRISETTFYDPVPGNPVPIYTDSTTNSLSAYWNFGGVKGVVAATVLKNASQQVVARSEITYDNSSTTANPLSTRAWDSTKSAAYSPLNNTNSILTEAQYDSYGNVTSTFDALGNRTDITYGSITGPNGPVSGLYPTETVAAANNATIKRTSSAIYDFYTGAVTEAKDVDNNVKTVTVYDQVGRPVIVKNAFSTSLENWVQTTYDDVGRMVITRAGDQITPGDGKSVSTTFYDQLGRVRLSKTLEDPNTQSATNEQDGIKVRTRYLANSNGSYQLVSNPYRAASPASETDPTMGWTLNTSFNSGRKQEVETFSGAALPAPWVGSNSASSGKVTTETDANRTLVTDQAGKQRISKTNALGQLMSVWEITGSDANTVSVSFPNYPLIGYGYKTDYVYDGLSNLIIVQQGSQPNRTYSYSSLSRLLTATNPESGTINYKYDANGSLLVKTDARLASSHYEYDDLGRITRRWNNGSNATDSTGSVHNSPSLPPGVASTFEAKYTYDQGVNGKGKLSTARTGEVSHGVWTAWTSNEYTYKVSGMVERYRQWIGKGGNYFDVSYNYFLSGNVKDITYPSGRTVNYTYDNAGRTKKVEGTLGDGTLRTYSQDMEYAAFGSLREERIGTITPLYHKQQFNPRGQLEVLRLSTTQAPWDGDRGSILNYFGGSTTNNGNVTKQEIYVPGSNFYQQNYSYDALNRLTSVTEKLNGSGNDSFIQTFDYDRYGNRTINNNLTVNAPKPQFTLNAAENRLYAWNEPNAPCTNTSTSRLMCYDDAGNLIRDKHVTNAAWMAFDGEGKMVQHSKNDALDDTVFYLYDADGKRKQSAISTENAQNYVHGLGGEVLCDTNFNKIKKEYVYRNGQILMSITQSNRNIPSDLRFMIADHLGTPRIVADKTGNLAGIKRHDYLPFGEEIGSTVGGRSTGQGYGNPQADGVRQQFTGYERDLESGLDFAQARYMGSSLGRFSSPDPLLASAQPVSPQTYNRYSYVGNNPLALVDPSGLTWYSRKDTGGVEQFKWFGAQDEVEEGYQIYMGSFDYFTADQNHVYLNPLGPNKKGSTDWERKGWRIDNTPAVFTTYDAPYDPGGELVGMELFLGIEGGVGGFRAVGGIIARADANAGAAALSQITRETDATAALVGRSRNLAVADFEIEGVGSSRLVAGSGPTPLGTVGVPPNPMFKPQVHGGWLRNSDSEYKLFEHIGAGIQNANARGTVRMFTERNMCDSCANIADQFRQRFPNINVVVKGGGRKQ